MKKVFNAILAAIAISFSSASMALTFLELNTEFLWDHLEPHEGRIIDEKKPAPTRDDYKYEVVSFSRIILAQDADVVGLLEIEGCHVSKDFATVLNKLDTDNQWKHVCMKGRDHFTGQDVALLTKHTIHPNTANNHKQSISMMDEKKVRPSKVLTTMVDIEGESYLFTVAHLISKAGDNDRKRLHQAKAINETLKSLISKHNPDHVVLMGDLNDTSESAPVLEFGKLGLINPATSGTCSYIYRGKCNLIDHILVSPSLQGGTLSHLDLTDSLSDHHSIKYVVSD